MPDANEPDAGEQPSSGGCSSSPRARAHDAWLIAIAAILLASRRRRDRGLH